MADDEVDLQDCLYEKLEAHFIGPMGWTSERLDAYMQSITDLDPYEEFIILIEIILNHGAPLDFYQNPLRHDFALAYFGPHLETLIRSADLELELDLAPAILGLSIPPILTQLLEFSGANLRIYGAGTELRCDLSLRATNWLKSSFFDSNQSRPNFNLKLRQLHAKIVGPHPELLFHFKSIPNPDWAHFWSFLTFLIKFEPGINLFVTYRHQVTVVTTVEELHHYLRSLI